MTSARLISLLALGSACLVFDSPTARADEGSSETSDTFHDQQPFEKNYFRTILEVTGVLAIGFVWYQYTASNSQDWDLGYGWPALKSKLTFEAVRFDTNYYDTNMLSHPMEGAVLYAAARGNHLSILESTFVSFAGSTIWEYIGELKEQASINDLIVTPVSGAAIGEVTMQLGAFFDRGRRGFLSDLLATVFAPTKKVHDLADGRTSRHATNTDDLGFTRDVGHAFDFQVGGGATKQRASRAAYADLRLSLHTEIQNVPKWDDGGVASGLLTDGNFSRLEAETIWGDGRLADLRFLTRVAPFSYYWKDLERDEADSHSFHGTRGWVGTTVGFDYDNHRWDRRQPAVEDPVSSVHLGGLDVDLERFAGKLRVRGRVHAHAGFAAVRSLAVDDFIDGGRDTARLPTVAQQQRYYYAWSGTIAPAIELRHGGFEAGVLGQLDLYAGIEGGDRRAEVPATPEPLRDRRSFGRTWFGYTPVAGVRLTAGAEVRLRHSEVADVYTRALETSVFGGVAAVF